MREIGSAVQIKLATLGKALLIALLLGSAAAAQMAPGQNKHPEVVGTWMLVSVDNVHPDGSHTPRHGAHPAGQLILDAEGHYSLIVITEGTPEELKSAVEGDNCDYGHYTVNEAEHSITFFMDRANHPELEGTSHTRYYILNGDELRYVTTRPSPKGKPQGTFGEVVLRRAPKG